MHWVLLHLSKGITLENVAEEAVMSFLEAIEIILKDLVVSFKHLDFAECQRCIMSVLYLVEVEDVPIYIFNLKVLYQLCDVFFFKKE